MSNIQIASNSTLDNSVGYKIKVTQDPGAATDGQVSYTFTLTDNAGTAIKAVDGTTDIAATTTVTSAAGSTKITLGDISFDLDNAKMWASDNNDDATADSAWNGDSVALTISNKVNVKQINTGEIQSITLADNAAGGAQTFTFAGAEAGTLKLNVTDTANVLVRGNTFTTNVTDTDKYTIKLAGQTAPDTVLTENQLTAANLTNINLGDAGNGVTLDLDAAKLNAMAVGTSTIDFNVASGTELTATLKNMDGSAVAGSGSTALTGAGAGSVADLGNGIKLTYDGTTPNTTVKAGEVVVSVKDVIPDDDFQAVLKKSTDGGATYGTTVEAKSFNKGDAVDFTNGLNLQTAAGTTTADNATLEIENGTVDKSLTMQVGANAGQTFSINMNDMRADALDLSNTVASAEKEVTNSQGDTIKASYRSTTEGKEVTNGTDNTGTEFALDVTDAKKATAAIAVLDEAIQKVSARTF